MGAAHPPAASRKAVITPISDTEVRIERWFDAPRELVWRAHTEPELMKRWLGPRRLTMRVEEMDVRPGGRWRFVHVDTDGTEYGFHGEYLEVRRPERIAQTWIFEGVPEAGSVETLTLTEEGGRTRLVAFSKFQKREHVEGNFQAGMVEGMNEGYERLDELLPTLR
jgi:uncharacterized protein YndB with AHSA1/START domain